MSFDSITSSLLLKMFDQLPFKDRVRLRGVNRLFNEVSWRSTNFMRSLEINDDLMNYTQMIQPFPSLLESCSPILESITATNRSCNVSLVSALADFDYPKLERLEITLTNNELTKNLISRHRNLRSVILRLDQVFEWPEDILLEKLENLEFHSSKTPNENAFVNLSPTLHPLIGKVPNLERFVIDKEFMMAPFILSVQELNQLLAAAPCLKELHLSLFRPYENPVNAPFINMCQDLVAAIPTLFLPNLTTLVIRLKRLVLPASILQHFATSSPQLRSIVLENITKIDDQTLMALSNLSQLRELSLPDLEMSKDNLSMMDTLLPSITSFYIKKIDRQALLALPQLQHLHAFSAFFMGMAKDEIINVVTNFLSLSVLGIISISNACSHKSLIDFVTSTAALFHRNLEIQLYSMRVYGNESDLDQMKATLEEIEMNGGPIVEMDGRNVRKIRYRSLA